MVSPRKRKSFSTVVACALVLSGLATAAMAADTEPAPRFNAKTMSGEKFTNDSLKGKVVLLQFWATWCQFCRSEQALVDSLDHEFGGKGLVVLAVDVNESKKTVKKYLEQSPRSCRVVLTEDTNLAAMFAANRYPIYVVIGRDGDVVGTQHGAAGERALRSLLRRAGIQSEQQTSSESGQRHLSNSGHVYEGESHEVPGAMAF